jgi:hypothetical protein
MEACDRAALTAVRLGHFVDRMEDVVVRNRARQNENILIGVTARLAQQKRGRKRFEQRHIDADKRWAPVRDAFKQFMGTHPKFSESAAIRHFMNNAKLQKEHKLKGVPFDTIKSAIRRG